MTNNKFINAKIPVSNRREAELAAKSAEELGYRANGKFVKYKTDTEYLTLINNGYYGFWAHEDEMPVTPLSEFLNQSRTETVTLDNGEKWRVKLIERVQEEPMSAEEFFHSKGGVTNAHHWMVVMEAYAKYRLDFERELNKGN